MSKLNSLIPMKIPGGGRTFVNSWDVPNKVAAGWSVIGDIESHTARTDAPVDLLTEAQPAAADPVAKPAKPPAADAAATKRP